MNLFDFLNKTKLDKEDFSVIKECVLFVTEYAKLRLSESRTALSAYQEPNSILNPGIFRIIDTQTNEPSDNPEELLQKNIESLEIALKEYNRLIEKLKPVEDLWE